MKKILTILLITSMITTLSACTNKKESNKEETNVGLINPIKELSSLDELSNKIDMALFKYEGNDINEEHYRLINSEYKIAEYEVKIGETTYTIRASKAPCSIDISGIYFNGDQLFANYLQEETTIYIENDEYTATRWFNVDGQYVVYTDEKEMDYGTFNSFVKQTQQIKPLNWNSDVAYEDYRKICGYYMDDNFNMTSIDIKGNQAVVYITIANGEGTKTYQMNAVLKDDELVFEEASVSYFEYNYETDESKVEELPSSGKGSITINGDALSFINSGIEELANIEMTKFEF